MSNRVRNRAAHRMDRLKKYRAGRSDAPTPPPRREHVRSRSTEDSDMESMVPPGMTIEDLIEESKILREGGHTIALEFIKRTREWCAANGVPPHPRLESAAEYLGGAMIIGRRSIIPDGKTEAEIVNDGLMMILRTAGDRDEKGIADAIVQITDAMKALATWNSSEE
ncbi:MAG TPA: hypothetical protein VFC46_02610 [Humisphaera sp.]|nr:hypothetical protein [Humisphaera sp.]